MTAATENEDQPHRWGHNRKAEFRTLRHTLSGLEVGGQPLIRATSFALMAALVCRHSGLNAALDFVGVCVRSAQR
jgi:hypothetical protein